MVRKLFIPVLAVAMNAVLVVPGWSANYKIDPGHSFVQFRIKHLGFSWLSGRFNKVSGKFKYDPEAGPEAQSISVTIDTASIDTNHAERDKHLRGADFLEVDKYPEAKFESTGYKGDANGGMMTGNLTLHGVTKAIEFPVKKIGEGKDPWGGYRAGFEGSYTLTRSDFKLDQFNLGPASVSLEMQLYVEGIREK